MNKRVSRRGRLDRGRRSPSIYSRTEKLSVPPSFVSKLLILIIVLLFAPVIYYIFFSGNFAVKAINTNQLKYIDKSVIEKDINSFIDQNFFNQNLVTLSASSLSARLNSHEGVKEVKISKKFPSTLSVDIAEETPVFIWETLSNKYLVDETGRIVGNYEEKYKDFPVVIDSKNVPIKTGERELVASSQFVAFVVALDREFENYADSKIKRIEVPEITRELKVTSEEGWSAYFDTTRTAKNQLINLSRILGEVKSKNKKIEYIDLRIDNRIFYK